MDETSALIIEAAACLSLLLFCTGALVRQFHYLKQVALGLLLVTFIIAVLLSAPRLKWFVFLFKEPEKVAMIEVPYWIERKTGLETTECPVLFDNKKVDRVNLVRLDGSRFDFAVHYDQAPLREIEEWQEYLRADVVINGSYFAADRTPVTPLRSNGVAFGPERYASKHGAFVANPGFSIIELEGKDTFQQIDKYLEAMVSYPLLLDGNGEVHIKENTERQARRSFIALDRSNRIILGTTDGNFFSLRSLALFLKSAPLNLKIALNLDGGPVASQIVSASGFKRVVNGSAESNMLPIVLAISAKR